MFYDHKLGDGFTAYVTPPTQKNWIPQTTKLKSSNMTYHTESPHSC